MAIETLRNNSILEIIGSTGVKVVAETIDSGEINERKRFTISGKVKLNKPKTIGTLKLTAAENKRFLKTPGINKITNKKIELNSNLRLSLKSIERDTNSNITLYLYDLIYNGKENISSSSLDYTLINRVANITTKRTGIFNVAHGSRLLSKNGETRRIIVMGTPGSTFELSITKAQFSYSRYPHEAGGGEYSGYHKPKILSSTETDWLNSSEANASYGSSNIGTIRIIKSKIKFDGTYSFHQFFPKIKASDIYNKGLGKYFINIKPTDPINYKQGKTMLEKYGFMKERPGWDTGWYSKMLTQAYYPKITLRLTTDSVLYNINGQAIPDGASTQTVDIVYSRKRNKNKRKVTYTCKAIGSRSFSATGKTQTFSRSGASDWNDVTPTTSKGAIVDIRNIKQTISTSTNGHANDTFTFSFYFDITRFPNEDLVITTPLNSLVNCS